MNVPSTRRRVLALGAVASVGGYLGFRALLGSDEVRCRGDPVSVEESVPETPGYDDDFEYVAANDTVRIVTLRSDDGPAGFAVRPFEEWAASVCTRVAAETARTVTAERLGTDEFGSLVGSRRESTSVVTLEATSGRASASSTTVSRTQLVEAAPKSVTVTVTLESSADATFSQSVPVFAREAVRRMTVHDR